MPVFEIRYDPGNPYQSDNVNASSVKVDSATGEYKWDVAGTKVKALDDTHDQTVAGVKTFTSAPVNSASGAPNVAVVNLAGATWHTGNGTADYLTWTAPAAVVITRVIINTTTKSSGAATADVGTSVSNNHTNGDNIFDALDIGTATICADNIVPPTTIDTEKSVVALASGGFLNFHALADPTGLVGKAYIYYFNL